MSYVEVYEQHRVHLLGVAYRMLGALSDAEDVLQDAFLRWQNTAHEQVTSPRAYLTSTVTRLCIDRLRQLKARREDYVGPWLPEPLVQGAETDMAELADAISLAILAVLENLGPVERAVFLLREVFDYDYPDIAQVVERSEANCRKIFQRARHHVDARQARFEPTPEQHEQVTQRFMASIASGQLDQLVAVLKDDITLVSDSGGKVPAARRPIVGADRVARFMLGIIAKAPTSFRSHRCWVNGWPGICVTTDGQVDSVMTWESDGERISTIRIVRNPDKLRHVEMESEVNAHSVLDSSAPIMSSCWRDSRKSSATDSRSASP